MDSGAKDDGSEWIVWTEYYDKINGLNDHWAKGRVMSHVQLMPYHTSISHTHIHHIISYPSTNTGQASGMLGDFMGMVTGEDAEAKFIQPLKVLHEVNHLIPTKDKPRASLSDLSNAAQLLVVFTVPKELVAEAQKMIDDHAVWMQELHGNHKMLGRDISFMPEHELLYYSAGSCPVLVNHMDLSSGSDPDGSFIFVITEFYKTKAGLENQWKHGKEMAEAKGEDFTLGQMDALEKKGMQTTFIQPLAVKASINWFGKPGTD